jgi:hypothetical protein
MVNSPQELHCRIVRRFNNQGKGGKLFFAVSLFLSAVFGRVLLGAGRSWQKESTEFRFAFAK